MSKLYILEKLNSCNFRKCKITHKVSVRQTTPEFKISNSNAMTDSYI